MRLRKLHDMLRADITGTTERGKLVRSAAATAALNLGGTLIAFGSSLLYARVLGPHDYGLYAYVIAWASVLTVPVGLGLPPYLVREGARSIESLRWLRSWADARVVVSGLIMAAIMACAVFLPAAAGARWLFVIAAPLPLLNNLGHIRRALLRANGWVARSQWPGLTLSPALMLAAMAGLWAWRGTLRPMDLVMSAAALALVPLLINAYQLRLAAPDSNKKRSSVRIRNALPFMWIGMLYLLNSRTDLIMLGAIKGAHEAGVYAVTARAGSLVAFFLTPADMVMATRIARLHHENNHDLLQRLLSGATRRVFAISIPIAIIFIFAARPLLSWVYGLSYADGAVALRILAGAQLVSVIAGPTATLLNMTGHEKLAALGVGASVILNIALNAALIPLYGIEGAAIATGISILTWNMLLWYWIRRHLRLRPTAFGL